MKHTAKTLKRLLKKAGLKRSGSKKTLRARAKRAHLVRGGAGADVTTQLQPGGYLFKSGDPGTGGRRRHRSRSSSSGSDKY